MKRLYSLILCLLVAVLAFAQQEGNGRRFSPEKFDAELQQFIVQEAHLTPQESAKFFPVYKEMQHKQRAIYDRMRKKGWIKPQDEEACRRAIRDRDEADVELKRIQQTYHNKFLDILPSSKVYDIIEAEDRFHRRMLKRWSNKPQEKKR